MSRRITGLPSPHADGAPSARPVGATLPAPGAAATPKPAHNPRGLPAPGERKSTPTPRITLPGLGGARATPLAPAMTVRPDATEEFAQPSLPSLPPLSPRAKRHLAGAGGVLALLIVIGFGIHHLGKTPGEGRVLELVAAELNPARVRPVALKDGEIESSGERSARVRGTLVVRAVEDLYAPVEAASLLEGISPERLAEIEAARARWTGYSGSRVRELAALPAPPPALRGGTFIARTHEAGVEISGEFSATVIKGQAGWTLRHWDLRGDQVDRTGALRGALPAEAIELSTGDLTAERARLLAEQQAYEDAFVAARAKVADRLLAERGGRVEDLIAPLSVGRLAELMIETNEGPRAGWLEVTRFDLAAGSWAGWLRDPTSWTETREFTGQVKLNEDATELRFEIVSPSVGRDPLYGPLVAYARALNLRFARTPGPGSPVLAAGPKGAALRLLSEKETAERKTALRAGLDAELARLGENGLWQGTATRQGRTESIALRIRGVDTDGTLEAVMWEAARPDRVRRASGRLRVVAGAARHAAVMIDFSSANSVAGASRTSVMAYLTRPVALKLEEGRLAGEGGAYRFAFEPPAADAAAGLRVAAEQAAANASAVAVAPGEGANAPDVSRPAPVGRVPLVIDTTKLPPLPGKNGAYALSDGKWVPLPANNGKARMSLFKIGTGAISGLGKAVRGAIGPEGAAAESSRPVRVVGKLVFDGQDRPPNLGGAGALTLVFIGSWASPTTDDIAKHPALAQAPDIEAGATTTDKRGRREIDLREAAPGWANFGDARVSADWGKLTPDTLIWRARGPVSAGRYALVAGGSAFEFIVR